jgi:putative ABC transport system permease protein
METLFQDLRYSFRMLAKKPAFTAIVVFVMALGIGATTAIFSVVNAIVLRPLPYQNPDRLVMVWMDNRKLGIDQDWHSYPNYLDYRDHNQTFETIAAFNNRSFNLTGIGEPERVLAVWSTANLFPLLGVAPAHGRTFNEEEETPGKDRVAVISDGLWKRRFGGDPGILNQPIQLNEQSVQVIGIMPPGFHFPQKDTEMWVPIALNERQRAARNSISYKAIGQLKPGVTLAQARADMSAIAASLVERFPDQAGYGANLVALHEQVVGNVRVALWVMLAAVGFVLLIACANVANLLLAQAAVREREIAIRTALGASRWRIVFQLLTESSVLALVSGGLGLLVAWWGLKALISLSPADIPRLDQVHISTGVLGFTLGVSVLTGLIFGLVPALQASKLDLAESLKEGGRGSTTGMHGSRVRNLLVIAEVALSIVLLIGAGLMIKSFINLQHFNLGFNPERLLTLQVSLAGSKYRDGNQAANFYKQVLERVANTPGVESVGAISTIFLSKTPNSTNFTIENRPPVPDAENIEVPLDAVSLNYFRTMGIPLLAGRDFDERDVDGTLPVGIINDTFARRFFPNEDPVGKRYVYGRPAPDNPWITIVGIVGDMRRTGFDSEVRPETFLPHGQFRARSMTMVVRASGNPTNLAGTIRNQIWEVDKDQPISQIRTMQETLGEMMAQRRFNMLLIGIFAAVALILASVGIYGVISYAVTQRAHELGVRMALGAQPRDVLKLILGQGMLLALIGVVIGIVASLALTRFMATLLYGVSATDPLIFALIGATLSGTALVACFVPALRATKTDPMIALRQE